MVLTVANAHHSTVLALTDDGVDFLRLEVGYDKTFEAALAATAAQIAGALRMFPVVDAVWITSPSYEGDVADIAEIAEACHSQGAILIVDAAWGAHFPFHPHLPDPPCALGADISVTSLHKLGGGPQGTALLTYRITRATTPGGHELPAKSRTSLVAARHWRTSDFAGDSRRLGTEFIFVPNRPARGSASTANTSPDRLSTLTDAVCRAAGQLPQTAVTTLADGQLRALNRSRASPPRRHACVRDQS
jgi:Orn/Lys/Arg decarboxylase, major domain